jgi:hypothetical protein
MKSGGGSSSEAGGATDRRSRHGGVPTRREALALIAQGAALLIAGTPEADPPDIVIVDGWILSPADLLPHA